jgi:hypothetical protein
MCGRVCLELRNEIEDVRVEEFVIRQSEQQAEGRLKSRRLSSGI